MKCPSLHPRESPSMPTDPVPANRSSQRPSAGSPRPPSREMNASNIAPRTFSIMGRVRSPTCEWIRMPEAAPPMILNLRLVLAFVPPWRPLRRSSLSSSASFWETSSSRILWSGMLLRICWAAMPSFWSSSSSSSSSLSRSSPKLEEPASKASTDQPLSRLNISSSSSSSPSSSPTQVTSPRSSSSPSRSPIKASRSIFPRSSSSPNPSVSEL
mmetsp:Transcript_36361/g.102722  ORF Transcript_36361/g.102722 Transcript_36361/m.102722 type:complete len:213 (+) Transcript_36361:466-1104(+)